MQRYHYQITEEEFLTYCKYSIYGTAGIKLERFSMMLSVPILIVILLCAFKPAFWAVYAVSAVAAVIWFDISTQLFSRLLSRAVRKEYQKKAAEISYQEIDLELRDDELYIDGVRETVSDYVFLPDMISLTCGDRRNIIAPLRIFDSNKEAAVFLKTASAHVK